MQIVGGGDKSKDIVLLVCGAKEGLEKTTSVANLSRAGQVWRLAPGQAAKMTRGDAVFFKEQEAHWDITNPLTLTIKELEIGVGAGREEDEQGDEEREALIGKAVEKGIGKRQAKKMTTEELRQTVGD